MPPETQGQANDKSPDATQPVARLTVNSNLVVVRVVVRDARGAPVEGLTKSDFKLFDRGQEQPILQFEGHSSLLPVAAPVGQAAPATVAALPENFLALYFDDLYTSFADLNHAREAAVRYLTAHLQPLDRVAIFTSGAMLSDFTSDPKQIQDALLKLRVNSRGLTQIQDCPQISDYQSYQIDQTVDGDGSNDNDSMKIAMRDAYQCPGISPLTPSQIIRNEVKDKARRIVAQNQVLARSNLGGIQHVVDAIARTPGQRTVILVSPGFLSESEQEPLDRMIDRALRSQVVISSLDPKGLAILMREADTSQRNTAGVGLAAAVNGLDSQRETAATGVLAEVARGTGGESFHNNNDLNAGLGSLAGSPTYYILAFSPKDLKPDGRFHSLKVTVADSQRAYNIQARRGYFASPSTTEAASAQGDAKAAPAKSGEAGVLDSAMHEQIREALFAKNDTTQFAVKLDTKLADVAGETRQLAVSSHLDGKDLPFQKDGATSSNTVTFVFGVFDPKGTLLSAQQRHVDLTIPDGQMPSFLQAGVQQDVSFALKPGTYRVREIVIDSAEHHMTSLSRSVKIP